MSLEATYLGNATDGGSDRTPGTDTIRAIPFTVSEDGFVIAIEVAMKSGTVRPGVALMDDEAGVPGDFKTVSGYGDSSTTLNDTVRFVTLPVMMWLAAGDYWAGSLFGTGGAEDIRYVVGASGDGYTIDGDINFVLSEPGATGVTATAVTDAYSVRVVMLQVPAPYHLVDQSGRGWIIA